MIVVAVIVILIVIMIGPLQEDPAVRRFQLHAGSGRQGSQRNGLRLSTNHFDIIREMYGLNRCVFLVLRIWAP